MERFWYKMRLKYLCSVNLKVTRDYSTNRQIQRDAAHLWRELILRRLTNIWIRESAASTKSTITVVEM